MELDKIIQQKLTVEMLPYMKEHSDIDARKRKLESLFNELICDGTIFKFKIEYKEDMPRVYCWTTDSMFPNWKTVFDLNLNVEVL